MVAPLLLSIQHLPQMPLLFCLLAHTCTCGDCFTWNNHPSRNWHPSSAQSCNCFSCFWSDATVLVALLVVNLKGRSPQKGHLWPRNYTTPTQLCQGFLTRFFKKFFSTQCPQSRNCTHFCATRCNAKARRFKIAVFLVLRLKTIFNQVSNSIWKRFQIWKLNLNLIFNLKTISCFTWNLITKSPFMGRKL